MLFNKRPQQQYNSRSQSNNRNKFIALASLVVFFFFMLIISSLFSNKDKSASNNSDFKTYSTARFEIQVPKDFYLSQSSTKTVLSNKDDSENISITRFLEATPGNTPEKIKSLTIKAADGTLLEGYSAEQIQVNKKKTLLVKSETSRVYYIYYDSYVWRLELNSTLTNQPIFNNAETIAKSFKIK